MEDISKLELAAHLIMAPPSQVSFQDRKDAESFFMRLREGALSVDSCRQILETTQNHFLMFELARSLVARMLKEWAKFNQEDIRNIALYLLNFPVVHQDLPNFVSTEMFHSAAMIIKRNSLVAHENTFADLLSILETFFNNENQKLQSFGLQIIELVATEFSTIWRSSNISITWDFHLNAKKQFEDVLLKQLMQLSLRTLSNLLSTSPDLNSIIEQQISSLIGDALGPSGPIAVVMPLVGNLGERRLATVMGGIDEPLSSRKPILHDLYVQTFVSQMIDLFSDMVLDHEMVSLSLVIYKLFTCHPILIFERFPDELLHRFVDFVAKNILKLTQPTIFLAMKNDQTYSSALGNLFQVWRPLLRSAHIFKENISVLIESHNVAIIETFIKSVLSPPFGNREKPTSGEIYDENEDEEDDRIVFMDILCDIGFFCLYSIDYFVDFVTRAIVQRLVELTSLNLQTVDSKQLEIWQEDFHWILLIIGHFIRHNSYSYIGNIPEELALKCLKGYQSGEFTKFDDFSPLFQNCIDNPPFNPANYPGRLDPVTLIATQILSWFSLEHQMLIKLDPNASLLSPTLCQTSLWQFSLLMIVLTPPSSPLEEDSSFTKESEEDNWGEDQSRISVKYLPSIPPKSALSAQIIQMSLEKMFTILTKMPGEKKLCSDVIKLLISLAEYRPLELAENENLYSLFSGIDFSNLPARRQFVKAIVLMGGMLELPILRQRIQETILEPLIQRFLAFCEARDSIVNSRLTDLFECFTGIADAGQADTARTLFKFLQPVYERCIPLIRTCSQSQPLIVSILAFLKSNTDVLFFYVESKEDIQSYHNLLIGVINAYKDTQLQRFASFENATDDEQQTQDLTTFIEILCLAITKTYLPLDLSEASAIDSAKVSLHGLEILLPMMSEDLLKIPLLCTSFFRLLIFISDIAPEAIVQVSEQMLNGFLGCVQSALDNTFGIERVRSALEIVNNFASHCLLQIQKGQPVSPLLAENILKFIPKIFELAMQFSCELEIFNEATSTLFTLIGLNQDSFKAYLNQLLSLPSNIENKSALEQAFTKLLTTSSDDEATPRNFTASKKRNFQIKFEIVEFLHFRFKFKQNLHILGIESSCDDAAVSIICQEERRILCDIRSSDFKTNSRMGGICPHSSARHHREAFPRLIRDALAECKMRAYDVDIVAVTNRPGLVNCLKVGIEHAICFARKYHRPLIPIHHMRAHALIARLLFSELNYPFISLLISGGHCILCIVYSPVDFKILLDTKSGSPGECLDKLARELGLQQLNGNLDKPHYTLTLPKADISQDLDFDSIKGRYLRIIREKLKNNKNDEIVDLCAAIQIAWAGLEIFNRKENDKIYWPNELPDFILASHKSPIGPRIELK
uniref:Exportin-4 n=1 Tax=Meloidogyne javanica TaxID=6303 RepID=A0A915LHB8_MELJA